MEPLNQAITAFNYSEVSDSILASSGPEGSPAAFVFAHNDTTVLYNMYNMMYIYLIDGEIPSSIDRVNDLFRDSESKLDSIYVYLEFYGFRALISADSSLFCNRVFIGCSRITNEDGYFKASWRLDCEPRSSLSCREEYTERLVVFKPGYRVWSYDADRDTIFGGGYRDSLNIYMEKLDNQ